MARLFVAITPPPDVLATLAEAVARARAAWPGGERTTRWVGPERWHVTLAFLGAVDDGLRPGLDARLARLAGRHPPVTIMIGGGGTFGGRILWLGARGDGLAALARGARRAATRAGVPGGEERPFRGHMTLGYARDPGSVRPGVAALDAVPALRWTADAIELVDSVQGPTPSYRREGLWPLGGGPARPARPASTTP